jgi:hypothetical protein
MPFWDKVFNTFLICIWLTAFSALAWSVYVTDWHPLDSSHIVTDSMGIPLPGVSP